MAQRQINPDIDKALAELREKQAAIERGEPPVGVGSEDLGDLTGTEFGEKLAKWRKEHPAEEDLSERPGEIEPIEVPPLPYSVTEKLRRENFETQEDYAKACDGEIKFEEDDPLITEIEQVAHLTTELDRMRTLAINLLDLLRRTAVHVAARNALGEKSTEFCIACNNARHEACVLPEIWKAVNE